MAPRDLLLRTAYLLQVADVPAKVAFVLSRRPVLTVRGDIAAKADDDGRITVWGVRGQGDRILLRAHTPKTQTAEELARLVTARQLLVDAAEVARLDSLTPEQRARENVCDACLLRDREPGQERCRECGEREAA